MIKFAIVDIIGSSKKYIPCLLRELRQNNLIAGAEKDAGGETVYITHNLVAIKRIMQEYEGLMLDIHME